MANLPQIDMLVNGFGTDYTGGKAYGYVSGTSQLLTWYEDSLGTTPAANPFTLDTAGAATLYSSSRMKIDVRNADNVSAPGFPIDNISYAETVVSTDNRIHVDAGFNLTQAVIDAYGTTDFLTLYFGGGTWAVNEGVTIPSNLAVEMDYDTDFVIASTKTLRLEGPFRYNDQRVIFTGAGSVSFADTANVQTFAIWGCGSTDTMRDHTFIGLKSVDGAGSGLDADLLGGRPALDYLAAKPYILVQEQQSSGTDGGTFTQDDWRTRSLNTEVTDTDNLAVISSDTPIGNKITLQPGTYRFKATAPGFGCGAHKTRLRNLTASTTLALGTSGFGQNNTYNSLSNSEVMGQFVIAVESAIALQHYCLVTKATDGFGRAAVTGENEVYAQIELWRVVEAP